ncbi:MAG: Lar family restriction alleviation protein [Planctomycetia bacterium]|nr:Lar family restriction alleviation protein [Planctomycetia bacterium]
MAEKEKGSYLPDVDPSTILMVPEFQVRERTDPQYVEELVEAIQNEKERGNKAAIDNILCVTCGREKDGSLVCLDGHHRLMAARQVRQNVAVYVTCLERKDWTAECVRENVRHGRRLTPAELRDAVRVWFEEHPGTSDQEVSQWLHISKSRVGQIRRELTNIGQLNLSETVTGKDGKEYPREKRKPVSPCKNETSDEMPTPERFLKCAACGRKIYESQWWDESDVTIAKGITNDGTPEKVFCNFDCHDDWHSRQLNNAGTKILESAGLDKNGHPADDQPAPQNTEHGASVGEQECSTSRREQECSRSTTPELLPCPFCGQPAEVLLQGGNFFVTCRDTRCKVIVKTPCYKDEANAAKLWNTRWKSCGN